MARAYFAGGCFWCITPSFREKEGVTKVTSGYSGGDEENPTYEEVKSQSTGHRETICVEYDPSVISYRELVEEFLYSVNPFDEGGQYIDRGHSYTLAIYPSTPEEWQTAFEEVDLLENESGMHAYVAIENYKNFYTAEEYHQDYDLKNPEAFERELIESGRKEGKS